MAEDFDLKLKNLQEWMNQRIDYGWYPLKTMDEILKIFFETGCLLFRSEYQSKDISETKLFHLPFEDFNRLINSRKQ